MAASSLREIYFYASWLKGSDPFDAHIMTEYNNKDGIRVPVADIDKARDIARQMKVNSRKAASYDQIDTAYGMFFMEEFEDE